MRSSFSEFLAHPLVSILIGSAVTWFFAWFYYKRAGDELRKEAELLQKATNAIVYFLEHPSAEIEARRDAAGRIVGVIVSAAAHAQGGSSAKVWWTMRRKTPNYRWNGRAASVVLFSTTALARRSPKRCASYEAAA